MRVPDILRRLLRWDRLGLVLLLVLPTLTTSALGFLWLRERQLLLPFLAAVAGVGAIFVVVRSLARLILRPRKTDAPPPTLPEIRAEPDWTAQERAAFDTARRMIRKAPATSSWPDLPRQALQVVEHVAVTLSDGKRSALDFSVPEALLLADTVIIRYRAILRSHVPFVDQLNVGTAFWAYRHRNVAKALGTWGMRGWRIYRLLSNPPAGMLQELSGFLHSGVSETLSESFQRELRELLLEEVAHAAVQLYSGRMRFSDAELLGMELETSGRDRESLARPDEPVRILVVGQISAGKSTLVNAILRENLTETDMAPTTDRLIAYDVEIAGVPCRLLDTMGLDGSAGVRDRVAAEMMQSDLVLWAVRADRPARAPDAALMQAFQTLCASQPNRRFARIVAIATFADRLVSVRDAPEGWLPPTDRTRLSEAMHAISNELSIPLPRPVCAEEPEWNVDVVTAELEAALGEALMTQRNRRRHQGDTSRSTWDELGRAWRGGYGLAAQFGGRLRKRAVGEDISGTRSS
ncbi:GTPase family protein [Cereibacter johrii]|uniref:G domain-containing protein n=1 Tax=Cereibacter johrii TaxID=445629 RepID=A0ABX5J930_9RHOB|nr:GTPase [Cereibacter johrii]ODM41370.1 hypothetical protein A9O63_06405 [Cereibacter johrii]PTM76854.1 hypothetical protein C8J29_107133 [Cereibacter johrii]